MYNDAIYMKIIIQRREEWNYIEMKFLCIIDIKLAFIQSGLFKMLIEITKKHKWNID